jgi:hypothetical protein
VFIFKFKAGGVYSYHSTLTLNLLTTTIVAPPSNSSKWQMGFNSPFKGLRGEMMAYNLHQISDYCDCGAPSGVYVAVNTDIKSTH